MPTKLQRNKLNNFIKYMKPYKVLTKCIVNISNGNFAMPKPLGIMAMTALVGLLSLFANNTMALSITVDGGTSATKSFQLIPGSSNTSSNVAISVASSDTAGGYTLSMTGPNAAKTLIGTTNSSNTLGPITDTTWTSPLSFGDDTWGILPSKLCTGSTSDTCSTNTAYQPAPGTGTQIIDVTTSANVTATTYALAFGAKVSDTKTPDTYTGTITMTLTANATPYSIGFIDATANMPDTIHGSTTNSSVTLPTNIPTKDGYTFIGWCSVRTTDSTCSGTTYQPGGTYTLSNGAMTNLYAMWETAALYMQNVATWGSTLSIGDSVEAIDSRDGKSYWVAKLADGKIWMTQNLDYEITSTTLTPNDSDVVSDWTPIETAYTARNEAPTSNSDSRDPDSPPMGDISYIWTCNGSYTTPCSAEGGDVYYYTSGSTSLDTQYDSLSACTSAGHTEADCKHYHRGNYYTWTAAIASNDSSDISTDHAIAPSSICPKGWRLPIGASTESYSQTSTEFAYLLLQSNIISAYPSDMGNGTNARVSYATDGFNILRTDPLYFTRPGYIYGHMDNSDTYVGLLYEGGYDSLYWSSTVYSGGGAYGMGITYSEIVPTFRSVRSYGRSIRCVAK